MRPSAGSFGLEGSRSQTMSRWPWSTTVGAASRPGLAGTRITRFRPGVLLELEALPIGPLANVLDRRLLVT